MNAPSAWTVAGALIASAVSLIGLIINYFTFKEQLAEKERSTERTVQNEHVHFTGEMDVRYRELEGSLREEIAAHANALRAELNDVKIERDGWKTSYMALMSETSELKIQYASTVQQRDQYQRETESLRLRVRALELTLERFKERFDIKEELP